MARVRSPAYPALSLPAAIDTTRKVYGRQQKTAEPRDVVIRHMGYKSANGRAMKALSALIKYDFLEKSGEDGLRISDRAVAILYPDPDEPESRNRELVAASRAPVLFREIFERWETRPSEESLQAFLVRKGFNTNSTDQVARAFYDTYDLVSDLGDSYDSDPDAEPEEYEDEAMSQQPEPSSVPMRHKKPTFAGGSSPVNVTKPIFDFETVKIQTIIDNQEDLTELIFRLEQIKAMLPPKQQH